MPNICFLCASDEGIFLDITEDKTFFNKIETCLSLKASKDDALSTKICHKCAYEVDKCYDFVHKYEESRKELERNLKRNKTNCFFCQEPGKKGYFFNLKKTNKLNDAFHKIYYLFDELSNETDFFICLVCRYSIDLLFDLKSVSEEVSDKLHKIIKEGIDVGVLAKTRTTIVRRKTTRIKSPQIGLHSSFDSESDSSIIMARGTGKMSGNELSNKKNKNRFCDQCQIETEKGVDMFKIHRTGRTICKNCWITMDPENDPGKNKRKRNDSESDTKSCKVFLTDVLKNNDNDLKPYMIGKNNDGKIIYKINDDSSGNESRKSTKTKAQLKELPELKQSLSIKNKNIDDIIEISDESETSIDDKRKTRRSEKIINIVKNVEKSKKIVKPLKEEKAKFEKPLRASKKLEKINIIEKASTSRKRANGNQNLDTEISRPKRSRSSSIELVTSNVTMRPKRLIQKPNRDDNEPRKRNDSITSLSSAKNSKRETRGRRISVTPNKESSPIHEFKSPSSVQKSPVIKKGKSLKLQIEKRISFICAVCGTNFEDKEEYKSHQLLHLKDLEIKLQRVPEEEKIDKTERLINIQEPEQDEDNNSPEVENRLENLKKIDDSCNKESNDNVKKDIQNKIELLVTDNEISISGGEKDECVKDKTEPVIESVMNNEKDKDLEDKRELVEDKIESLIEDKKEITQDETILVKESVSEVNIEKINDKECEEKTETQSQDEERQNLEDLLQGNELQVIDEIAESVSSAADPDEEKESKKLPEKIDSIEDESQEDFTVVYTGSSQDSVSDITVNPEETKKSENIDKESLEKVFVSLDKDVILPEEKEEEEEEKQEESLKHSSTTKDDIKNQDEEIKNNEIDNNQLEETSQILESVKVLDNIEESHEQTEIIVNQLDSIDVITETNEVFPDIVTSVEINPIFTDVEKNLQQESLSQEITNIVQNGLEEVINQVDNEIIDDNNILIDNKTDNNAEDTVTEVLQEVFNLATSKNYQKEDTEIINVSFNTQNILEDISNDALNGGDMPSLETDESEVSNL